MSAGFWRSLLVGLLTTAFVGLLGDAFDAPAWWVLVAVILGVGAMLGWAAYEDRH